MYSVSVIIFQFYFVIVQAIKHFLLPIWFIRNSGVSILSHYTFLFRILHELSFVFGIVELLLFVMVFPCIKIGVSVLFDYILSFCEVSR